ncbi:MAG: FecR domain-containing protein [Verrucomicrobiaceae bacterium]|nr:FecR domain-containing protein [Verrucomicrobiaceae bacterium]
MKKMFQVGFAAFVLVVVAAGGQENHPAVARVDQILPFAITGQVTSATTSPKPDDTSTTSAPAQNTTAPALLSVTTAGGSISSGADGGVSLILGSSAQTGTARLAEDSEVKVPDESEKGHSLEVLKGKLFLNISADQLKRQGNAEFKLKTPAALLAVKGTKFFCRSIDGKDTVCVHEGSVEVTEPSTGKTLTIQAGLAAEISPGILSEMREMTDEETAQTSHYDLAALEHETMAMIVEGKTGAGASLYTININGSPYTSNKLTEREVGKQPVMFFGANLGGFVRGGVPKPEITEQGAVRYYAWAHNPGDANWLKNSIPNVLFGAADKSLVAIGFSIRSKGLEKARFNHQYSRVSKDLNNNFGCIYSPPPSDGAWSPLLLPLGPAMAGESFSVVVHHKTTRGNTEIAIETYNKPDRKGNLPINMPAVIEMKDFVIYSTP